MVLTAAANPSRAQAGRVETGPDGVVRVISVLGSNPVHAASHEFSLEVPNPDPVTVANFPYLYPRLLRVSNTGRVGLGYGVGESLRSTLNVGYGQPFTVAAKANGGTLARVTLVRLSSVTHSFNMNQRFLELPVTATATGSVTVTAPGSAADCPPGHYLLFVLNSNGTPSVGQVVHINASSCAVAPQLSTAYVPGSSGCTSTATASVSGQNLGTDYQWTINGVYDASFDGQSSATVELGPCQPQATLGVRVTPSCGGTPVENFVSVSRIFSRSSCPCERL